MARTETFTRLLDRASTPVQTYIILAQLALLRRQDKARLNPERGTSTPAMLLLIVAGIVIWAMMASAIALHIGTLLPFGH